MPRVLPPYAAAMGWLNHNAAAIQAVATVMLVLLTGAYATMTFFLSKHAREQILVTARASDAQTMLKVIDQLQAEHVRAARKIVQARLPLSPAAPWSAEEQHAAGVVCAAYDAIAMLVANELIDEEPFTTNWAGSLVRCYVACKPYIELIRKESGEVYWKHFEDAALRANARVAFPGGPEGSGAIDDGRGASEVAVSGSDRVKGSV
jgi:hypothetical protein